MAVATVAHPAPSAPHGNGSTACHHPAYGFNDKAVPDGVSYWVRLVEMGMPA